jgi:hypothetical protein
MQKPGAAPQVTPEDDKSSEGAKYFVRAFHVAPSALEFMIQFLERCPRLLHFAPLALSKPIRPCTTIGVFSFVFLTSPSSHGHS